MTLANKRKEKRISNSEVLEKLSCGIENVINEISFLKIDLDDSTIFIYLYNGTCIKDVYLTPEDAYDSFYRMYTLFRGDFIFFNSVFLFKEAGVTKIEKVDLNEKPEIILFFHHVKVICEAESFDTEAERDKRYLSLIKKAHRWA